MIRTPRIEHTCKHCGKDFFALASKERIFCSRSCKGRAEWKHKLTGTRFYVSWNNMKGRCLNLNNAKYKDYGARGITVCERWLEFQNFKEDMLSTYGDNLILDRIDVNGNYEPSNCRWVTIRESNENTRLTHLFTFKDKSMTIPRWAEYVGLKQSTLAMRLLSYGWNIERALTTPVGVSFGRSKGGALL